jgi:transcriptional regulator with XRE-family HTH domain
MKREPYLGLKGWLSEHGVSQIELAKVLGTTSNYINKKINGTGPDFKLSEVRIINSQLGVPVELFFEIKVPIKELKLEA